MMKENWERKLFYLLTPALMGDPFMALSMASSMEVVEVPVSSMSLQMWSFMFGSSGIRASIASECPLTCNRWWSRIP
jgi:hypothetical protein